MEMAVDDIYVLTGNKLKAHLRDSQGNRVLNAIDVIEKQRLQAVVGSLTWQEVKLITEMSNNTKGVPILSLATTSLTPSFMENQLPYFIHFANDISLHIRCISAIISSYRWHRIIAIYEDSNTYFIDSGIITLLSDSLRDVGSEIEHHLAFPPFSSLLHPKRVIKRQLEKLKSKQCRVFVVVQSSLQLALLLFQQAKELGMMGKGNVWITTDSVTSLLDSVNSSDISSMQGVLGFKTHYSISSSTFKDFEVRFRRRYQMAYPHDEDNFRPSIFALRAYDATWILGRTLLRLGENSTSKELLVELLSTNFKGLSGRISFKDGELSTVPIFSIVNVVGKSYLELGFWSLDFGFSGTIIEHEDSEKVYSSGSIEMLEPVYWPGGLRSVPPVVQSNFMTKPLRIGVPARGAFNQFVRVIYDHSNRTYVSGFSVDVFEAVVKHLLYDLPYVLVPYNGSYDDMVEQVYLKALDAAVGDTEIMADRCRYAEFSQPYVESGLVMVVVAKSHNSEEGWIFLRPFTKELWIAMIFMSIFTGFVVWMHESEKNPNFKLATILWFPVSTLFFAHREPIESNLARIVVGTWLFVVLIVISSYTAILTSMFTVSRLEPSMINVEFLKRTNAVVGCNGNSFIVRYLVDVVGFKKENVKRIDSVDHYPIAFQNKDIAAAFFVTLHAKVFIMKNCERYTMAGPTYKLGGFGFVFPKGSPLAFDISEAILKATEGGEIQMLEDNMLSSNNCSNSPNKIGETSVLGLTTFRVPFILSASVCAVTMLINVVLGHRAYREYMRLLLEHIIMWGLIVIDNVRNYIKTAFQFFLRIYANQVKKPDDVHQHGTIELAIQNITPG
ncbi:hypothetical protein AQUCO_05500121v1 [Aquilegia coerulea]|uniref:Glutamate receptor n=1 Tax=Aquilegia coerulea TaxID=218851 RepID=A0A2G5CH51_AQUCA|nr:hypothetical protein AQUCO_05500121v1 [Aquilegia coerulea]